MIRFLQTPGPLKKIVLGGVLLVICGAMVITLVPGGLGNEFGFGGPGQGVIAQVGGQDLTTEEASRTIDQTLQRQYPRADLAMVRQFFGDRILQQLIAKKALLAEAKRLGLRVTEEEVRDELQHGRYAATFFPGGKYIGQVAYENLLGQYSLNPTKFEDGVKEDLLMDKLRNLIAGSAAVTDLDIRREFTQRNTRVKFEYAVLNREDVLKNIHPSEAELKAFYEANKAAYNNSIPDKRKIRYALIDTTKLEAQTQVTTDELRAYYDQHRDEYRVPDQVNARQILFKTPLPGPDGKVDPKGTEEARKKADDVLKQLKAGGNFSDLARKYSEDPSGKTGGSIGWVQNFPVDAVQKIAFSLAKGGTSDVIDAGYAFLILHIDDKQSAHAKSLDEVKSQIEGVAKLQKVARIAESQANALLTAAKTNGLEKAAAVKGITVINTDFIGRTDSLPGIGASPQLVNAVFNADEKAPPELVQIPQGYAIFEVAGVQPPSTPTFEQIRSRVETEFKNQRAAASLSQKTQELSDRAKASHDLKKAAKELGATVKTSDFVLPEGQVPDIGSMQGQAAVAFTMKPGEISGPIAGASSGIVLSVIDKQQPTAEDFAAKKDEVRDSLLQQKQAQIFEVFASNLRDQMQKSGKIKINEDEKKKVVGSPTGLEGGA